MGPCPAGWGMRSLLYPVDSLIFGFVTVNLLSEAAILFFFAGCPALHKLMFTRAETKCQRILQPMYLGNRFQKTPLFAERHCKLVWASAAIYFNDRGRGLLYLFNKCSMEPGHVTVVSSAQYDKKKCIHQQKKNSERDEEPNVRVGKTKNKIGKSYEPGNF